MSCHNACLLVTLALAGCGFDTGDSTESVAEYEAALDQVAGRVAGNSGDALVISARTYTSGSAKAKVTGFFEVDGTQQSSQSCLTDEVQTLIPYGTSGGQELNVLFTNTFAMTEYGVTNGLGPYIVTARTTGGQYRTKVDMTPALVTGRYSCTRSTA